MILTLAAQGQMKRALIKYLSASKAKWTTTSPPLTPPVGLLATGLAPPLPRQEGRHQEDVEMATISDDDGDVAAPQH